MFGLNPKLWASKLLKLLAQQENLLVPDYWNGWDFFKALSWEIVQMPAYECPEAVAICLLLNNLLNTHYFSVLFRWARVCMKWGRSARHATGKGAGKMCCVWHSYLNLSCLRSPEKHKKNACYAGQLLRNERWSQERFIFDGPTEIETYHFYLQNVTWLVDQSITLLRQILVKARSNQRLLLQCL